MYKTCWQSGWMAPGNYTKNQSITVTPKFKPFFNVGKSTVFTTWRKFSISAGNLLRNLQQTDAPLFPRRQDRFPGLYVSKDGILATSFAKTKEGTNLRYLDWDVFQRWFFFQDFNQSFIFVSAVSMDKLYIYMYRPFLGRFFQCK